MFLLSLISHFEGMSHFLIQSSIPYWLISESAQKQRCHWLREELTRAERKIAQKFRIFKENEADEDFQVEEQAH